MQESYYVHLFTSGEKLSPASKECVYRCMQVWGVHLSVGGCMWAARMCVHICRSQRSMLVYFPDSLYYIFDVGPIIGSKLNNYVRMMASETQGYV